MAFQISAQDLQKFDIKTRHPDEFKNTMAKYLEQRCAAGIHDTILAEPDHMMHYGLPVDLKDLHHWDPELCYLVMHHPKDLLPFFDDALVEVQRKMVEEMVTAAANDTSNSVSQKGACDVIRRFVPRNGTPLNCSAAFSRKAPEGTHLGVCVKKNAHVRLKEHPFDSEHRMESISNIRSTDLQKLITVQGTVIRTGTMKMLEAKREYKCMNKTCGHIFAIYADMTQSNLLKQPKLCPASGRSGKGCKSHKFEEHGPQQCSDYQEIKIQEQVQKLGVGSIPRSILVILQDDLVDTCKAGDDVIVTGTLLRRWKPTYEGTRCSMEVTLRACSVAVVSGGENLAGITMEMQREFEQFWRDNAQKPLAGRDLLVASVCPQLYGLFSVKLAILLTLMGGVAETDDRGMRRRGTSHLLLIGDPGCGKSQFLRYAAKLAPRSVLTTGIGTTSAGLTCTAVKDGGEWVLEAGALVLADRGTCCIDEFSAIREHDRTTIHEAMEQQTISVAKAGLVCTLNTRACVFAVTNPKGTYDMDSSVTVNTAIGSPLLSRFDLVMLLLDTKDAEWDKVVSTFVLREAIDCGRRRGGGKGASSGGGAREPWSIEKLQKYIAWIHVEIPKVTLSQEAETVLSRYYQCQRKSDNPSAPKATIRVLESLIRLAQAHARIMCRDTVLLIDAVQSVVCMEASLLSCHLLTGANVIHSNFPEDPDKACALQQRHILDKMGLSDMGFDPPPSDDSAQQPPAESRHRASSQADVHARRGLHQENGGNNTDPGARAGTQPSQNTSKHDNHGTPGRSKWSTWAAEERDVDVYSQNSGQKRQKTDVGVLESIGFRVDSNAGTFAEAMRASQHRMQGSAAGSQNQQLHGHEKRNNSQPQHTRTQQQNRNTADISPPVQPSHAHTNNANIAHNGHLENNVTQQERSSPMENGSGLQEEEEEFGAEGTPPLRQSSQTSSINSQPTYKNSHVDKTQIERSQLPQKFQNVVQDGRNIEQQASIYSQSSQASSAHSQPTHAGEHVHIDRTQIDESQAVQNNRSLVHEGASIHEQEFIYSQASSVHSQPTHTEHIDMTQIDRSQITQKPQNIVPESRNIHQQMPPPGQSSALRNSLQTHIAQQGRSLHSIIGQSTTHMGHIGSGGTQVERTQLEQQNSQSVHIHPQAYEHAQQHNIAHVDALQKNHTELVPQSNLGLGLGLAVGEAGGVSSMFHDLPGVSDSLLFDEDEDD